MALCELALAASQDMAGIHPLLVCIQNYCSRQLPKGGSIAWAPTK